MSTEIETNTENQETLTQEAPKPEVKLIDINHFAAIDLRIAVIKEVTAVPKSKKLYKLQLDVGPLGERQILSGIAHKFTPEELVGRKIVIIANLQPAKLMGEESQGMLLAASTEDNETLALLSPNCEIPAGSKVR
jgi:methionyl-tRNA synthetase